MVGDGYASGATHERARQGYGAGKYIQKSSTNLRVALHLESFAPLSCHPLAYNF